MPTPQSIEAKTMPAKRTHLPPFDVILSLIGRSRSSQPITDDQPVTVPFGVLRLLLRGALLSVPFHEEHYLHLYSDVAGAVFRGEIRSGHEHFVTNGYFEGRQGCSQDFEESWYLDVNADVALAVRAGTFASAYDHYSQTGMFELRGPNPGADSDLAAWRAFCPTAASRPATAQDEPAELMPAR